MPNKELRNAIICGEIDINNQENLFAIIIKGTLNFLNNSIKVRNIQVPHMIISTGDDIMYREEMNYSYDILNVTNENFLYNIIPRCIAKFSDISTQPDQLTQPFSRGFFEITHNDIITSFTAEVKRMPIIISLGLNYYLDSMYDIMDLSQYLITNLSYIRTFKLTYLGETFIVSLTMPNAVGYDKELRIDFDTENRRGEISLTVEISANLPIYNNKTVVESDMLIRHTIHDLK